MWTSKAGIELSRALLRKGLTQIRPVYYLVLNRPQFARHFSVIQNDYERGEYEQEAISRRV